MLDFLGVTEHLSCMENTPFSFPALFRDMAGEAVSLDGVIFSGSIVSANQEVIEISIEKGESSNEVIFSFPALPEGRWSYNVLVQADDGSQRILFSGYISVLGVSRVAQLAGGPPMKNRTLLVAMPGEATMRLRMEWMATTAAQAFAYHALQASKNAHADSETASQAAKTATDAAATAAGRAEEAEGYAGAAWASKRAAADSASAAGTSATNAARDAKSANDAKTDVESLAATWPETVSNGEKKIVEAGNKAVNAIQDKQANSVLAVGRASQTAQQNIAGARTDAVAAVQTAQENAVGKIDPIVLRAETAKENIDQAERRINTAESNAATSATNAANSATVAQQALEAIPQVDDAGNMTLAGGLTAAGAINANGGVNIPLAVGAPTDTSAVNRLYASGLAAVTEAFSSQSFLSSFNSYGAAATVEQTVPGWCWRLKQTAEGSCTIKVHFLNPFLGVSNYSGWNGVVLPLAAGNTGSTVARKISFSIGKRGSVVEKTAESLDMFTLSPASGSTASFPRFVDVTFYLQSDASSSPAGYPVRVRELIYDAAAGKWVVHETQSVIPSFNTNPSATMFLACVQNRVATSGAEAGLWIGSNAYDTRRLLCIADLHALQDSFDFTGVDRVYWDSEDINAFSFIGAMRQLTAPGYNQPNGVYNAFRALETRLIQSTTVTEFTPYE